MVNRVLLVLACLAIISIVGCAPAAPDEGGAAPQEGPTGQRDSTAIEERGSMIPDPTPENPTEMVMGTSTPSGESAAMAEPQNTPAPSRPGAVAEAVANPSRPGAVAEVVADPTQPATVEGVAGPEASATPEPAASYTPLDLFDALGCSTIASESNMAQCFGSVVDESGNITGLHIRVPVDQAALGKAFLGLPSLGSLRLDHCEEFPSEIAHLTNLKTLALACDISGGFLADVGKLKGLNHLGINAGQLEGEIPQSVLGLPNLKWVSFTLDSGDPTAKSCVPAPTTPAGVRNYELFDDFPACGPELNELEQLITLNGILAKLGLERTLGSLGGRDDSVTVETDQRGHLTNLYIELSEAAQIST